MTASSTILRDTEPQGLPVTVGKPGRGGARSTSPSAVGAETPPNAAERLINLAPRDASASSGAHPVQQDHSGVYDAGFRDGFERARRELEEKAEQLIESRVAELEQAAFARTQEESDKQFARAQAAFKKQVGLLSALTHQLPCELERCLATAEEDMVGLAFEVICRVLGEQAASLDGLRGLVRTSLDAWHGRNPLSLHLHPSDLALLQADENCVGLLASAGFDASKGGLHWVADPQVTLGGCLLRSSEGELDARLEVQLQALRISLLQTRADRKDEAVRKPVNTAAMASTGVQR